MESPEIVQAYLRDPAGIAPLLHLPMEVGFCIRKQPVIWIRLIEGVHVRFEFLAQFFRQRNHPAAFLRLGFSNDLFPANGLERLADSQGADLQVDVLRT